MKKIILVRHGKSAWDFNVSDRDRPLKERGINDAHLVANTLKSLPINVDAIYSSPANRALHTAMIFLRTLQYPFTIFKVSDALYDFSGDSVIPFIKKTDNNLNTILLFGHNHAFTHIANQWGNREISNVPTAGLVVLNFKDNNWATIQKGTTEHYLYPKELKA